MWHLLDQISADPQAPAEVRNLAQALLQVLAGERDPDLSGLPEEWAEQVRGMVRRLEC